MTRLQSIRVTSQQRTISHNDETTIHWIDEGFWHRFSSLKPKKFSLPIIGFYAPCSHPLVSNYLTLLAESLPSESREASLIQEPSHGNRNKCPVSGILYNTNTVESFHALDKQNLLKEEARKIWEDIQTGRAVEDCSVLSRFLLISFADLKKCSFHYWFAFPALMIDPPATVVNLSPASQWLSKEQPVTSDVARNQQQMSPCQSNAHKILFGFYDPCHLPNIPGWPLRNFLALIAARWNLKSVQFFCYRENHGFADMSLSLIGEALLTVPHGWKDVVPKAVGWELYQGRKVPRCISLAQSMDPTRMAEYAADLNLKHMKRRDFFGLGCFVIPQVSSPWSRHTWMPGCAHAYGMGLFILVDNCLNGGEFKATAAVESLKRIFPAVEAEGIVMAIPMPGHPVNSQEHESVLDDCRRLCDLIDAHFAVFLLTDTRESRWLPTLLCANANIVLIEPS
ncbi:unnamed protein product [Vicia faba]|uniref:Ubiquitin-like modifier-activating enzyme ATG7 n=1 Tax=Vicia faba TaxID=3906 RepID=A0AAV1AQM5_VICFA|nr:unnamed protein product [Vicia faba]